MLLKAWIIICKELHRLGSKGLTVLFLLLFLSVSTTSADSELLFDLRNSDLNKEAFSLDGIVEFYENQILDPGLLLDSTESSKQVIHFPMGLKSWSDRSAKESDLYGTLRMSVLTDPELANTYLSLLVDLPAQEVKIWINGNRLYKDTNYNEENLWNQKTSSRQSVVFPAMGTKQEIIIQFKQLERKHPGAMAIILGNPSAVNSLVNSRFVVDVFYVLIVVVLLIFVFVMVTLGRRHDSRRFRKFIHLVMLACVISLFRFMAIDGNGLLFHLLGNYMDTYIRLKYAGLMLALPLLVVYMSRIPGIKIDSRLVKLAYPCFWFMTIVVVLGGSFQFDAIVKYFLIFEMSFCIYILFQVAKISYEKGQRAYHTGLFGMTLVYGLLAICLFSGAISGKNDGALQYGLTVLLLVIQIGLAVRVTREQVIKGTMKLSNDLDEQTIEGPFDDTNEDITKSLSDDVATLVEDHEGLPKQEPCYANQFGILLWIVDNRGTLLKVVGAWPEAIVDPKAACGSKVTEILSFNEEGQAALFDNVINEMDHDVSTISLLAQLPTICKWQEIPFKLNFVLLDQSAEPDRLLIKFESLSEQMQLEHELETLQKQHARYKRIFPDYVILRRVADDFIKYLRLDLLTLWDTYEKQDGIRRILSDLEWFKQFFSYYEMPNSSLYLLELREKLVTTPTLEREALLRYINESAILEDMRRLEQSYSGNLASDAHYKPLGMQDLDVLEMLLSSQSEDACIDKVRSAQRLKLELLQRSVEGYIRHRASQSKYSLDSVLIELDDVRLNEVLFWDLHKMMMHLINNSIEHGFETENDRIRRGKTGGNVIQITLKLMREEKGDVLQLAVRDNGHGIQLDDIRSKLYADHKMSFEDVQQLPDELAIRHVLNAGFSMPRKRRVVESGYGLHAVDEIAHQYGGEADVISDGTSGTTICVSLPYTIKADYGTQRHEMFIRALEQSLLNVAETVGFRKDDASSVSFYQAKNPNVTLDAYTSIQNIYWNQEIQVVFTANKQLLETISHVYGIDFKLLQRNETNDLLNEILNVTLGGAVRALSEKAHAVTIGKPIHFEGVTQIYLRADQVYVANFSRAGMVFTAFVAVG